MLGDPTSTLHAVLDLSPAPILFADGRGRLLHGNPAACELIGYPLLELRSLLHVSDLYQRPEDARRVLRRAREQGDGTREPVEAGIRTRSGEVVPVRVHLRVVKDPLGVFLGTIGLLEDRREVAGLRRRLEEAATQVIASERRVAQVTSATQVANELSQPLMAAMGNVELVLMRKDLDAQVSTRLERSYEQLERLRTTLSDFVRVAATRSLP